MAASVPAGSSTTSAASTRGESSSIRKVTNSIAFRLNGNLVRCRHSFRIAAATSRSFAALKNVTRMIISAACRATTIQVARASDAPAIRATCGPSEHTGWGGDNRGRNYDERGWGYDDWDRGRGGSLRFGSSLVRRTATVPNRGTCIVRLSSISTNGRSRWELRQR